jgi:hypothetical protein
MGGATTRETQELDTAIHLALLMLKDERKLRWTAFLNVAETFALIPSINRLRAIVQEYSLTEKVLFWRNVSEIIFRRIKNDPQKYLEINPNSLREFCHYLEIEAKKAHPSAVVTVHKPKIKEFMDSNIWSTRNSNELTELFFKELKRDSQTYVSCVVYIRSSGSSGRGDPAMC